MRGVALGIILALAIVFAIVPTVQAEPTRDDWKLEIYPTIIEVVVGKSAKFWVKTYLYEPFEPYTSLMYHEWFNAPEGITISLTSPYTPVWMTPTGNVAGAIEFTVSVDPNFTSREKQRVDMTFKLVTENAGYWEFWRSITLYVVPIDEDTWSVSYEPTYLLMNQGDNTLLNLTINNLSSRSLDFDVTLRYLNSGFSVNPAATSFSVAPKSSKNWISTLICTGYGLVANAEVGAVSWRVTNRQTGGIIDPRTTVVKYIGPGIEITGFEIKWEKTTIEVPFGEMENVNLILRNIGTTSISFGRGSIVFSWFAESPVWPYSWADPGPFILGPGETKSMKFTFWAHGDPNVITQYSYGTIRATDNYDNTRTAQIGMRAKVGTFELKIRPTILTLARGQAGYIYITIKNNENAIRNYIVRSEESVTKYPWAKSDPQVENVVLKAFEIIEVPFLVTALGERGEYGYWYYVTAEQTGKMGRIEATIKIIEVSTGAYPIIGQEILSVLVPLTGSIQAASNLAAMLIILGFAVIGSIVGQGWGIVPTLFVIIAIVFTSTMGWLPSWVLALVAVAFALYIAKYFRERF